MGTTSTKMDLGGHQVDALTFDVPTGISDGWWVMEGPCSTYETEDMVCVHDGEGAYDEGAFCQFAYIGDATLTWELFDIHAHYFWEYHYDCTMYDYITVNDESFCGAEEVKNSDESDYFRPSSSTFDVEGITRFRFQTDRSHYQENSFEGFSICAPKLATQPNQSGAGCSLPSGEIGVCVTQKSWLQFAER